MFYYGCDYYPEHRPEPFWEEDARRMREAGFNVVRIGEFAWARMEPAEGQYDWGWLDRAIETLYRHGLRIVLGTPTAAPPPWLVAAHPEILPRDRHRRVRHAGSRRHYCPNSPLYREYTRRIVITLAERYGSDERVVGWQIDNEFGCHDTGRCYCDVCTARFREWLRERYGSLDRLNEAWGTVFWSSIYRSWDEIPLPWAAPAEHNPAHLLDFLRFGTDSFRQYQQLQIDILRERAPGQFITHNYMPFHSRELDFYDLAAPLDFVSWDNYHFYGATPALVAATHDLYWGMQARNYWVMEQQVSQVNWAPYNPVFRPGEVGLKVWQSVAHGADGLLYFAWRATTQGAEIYHSGLLDYSNRPTRGYEEARRIGQILQRLAPYLEGSIPPAEVAILHDYPSRWSLDIQPHNRDLADDETFRQALMGPYQALWARNIPVHILRAAPETDLSAYKLVILPALNLIGPELAGRLQEYVHNGGALIATARTGFKDEYGRVPGQPPGHLAELVGVKVGEFDSLPPDRRNSVRFVYGPAGSAPVSLWMEVLQPTGARPLAVYEEDFYAGEPAATIAEVGQGRAFYVGILAGAEFYGPLMDWLLPQLGIRPPLATPEGVEAKVRAGPRGTVLFLLNHNDRAARVALPAPATDIITGERWDGGEIGAREIRIFLFPPVSAEKGG